MPDHIRPSGRVSIDPREPMVRRVTATRAIVTPATGRPTEENR